MAARTDIMALEAQRQDPATWNVIHLFKEGPFWHAYEWSAWIICTMTYNNKKVKENKSGEPLAVVHSPVSKKKPQETYTMVGFQMQSFDKFIPKRVKQEPIEDKQIDITIDMPQPTDGSTVDYQRLKAGFDKWKSEQPITKKADDEDKPQKPTKTEKAAAATSTPTATIATQILTDIEAELMAWPTEQKSLIDTLTFVNRLKGELAKRFIQKTT